MCSVPNLVSTVSIVLLNSLPLSVCTMVGGPINARMFLVKASATESAVLSSNGAKTTNLENVQTATIRCTWPAELLGSSTRRSIARVWRGPGGKGMRELHLGDVTVVSHN